MKKNVSSIKKIKIIEDKDDDSKTHEDNVNGYLNKGWIFLSNSCTSEPNSIWNCIYTTTVGRPW